MILKIGLASGLLIASAGAYAQSSVTLFGILDEGLNFTNNAGGHTAYQMTSVDLGTSHWGLRGTEDLGGGLHAVFDIESGFNLESGTNVYPGRAFGYQAYVGLQSDTLGTVTLGRQFDSISDTVALLTANGNWAGYLFTHPIDNDNTDGTYRINNSVKFTSNTYGGFSATALYGFSNQPGAFANNRELSAGVKYTYGTLSLAAAYADLNAAGGNPGGAIGSDDYYSIAAANQKIYGIGANYGIGKATVGLVYTHVNANRATDSVYVGAFPTNPDLKFDNVEFNIKYDFAPDFFVGGMYTYTRAKVQQGGNESSLHWNQAGLMAQYNLSKRTALYSQVVYQKASGADSGTPLDGAYIPGSAAVSSNSHQVVGRVAINHSF